MLSFSRLYLHIFDRVEVVKVKTKVMCFINLDEVVGDEVKEALLVQHC